MGNFYDLKKHLFFPRMAGVLKQKKDVPFLLDLIENERRVTRETTFEAAYKLRKSGHVRIAERMISDWRVLDTVYIHDAQLCETYMEEQGLSRI